MTPAPPPTDADVERVADEAALMACWQCDGQCEECALRVRARDRAAIAAMPAPAVPASEDK
jgi:hypothetical protein